jgi:hypothetical protein
MHLAGCQNLTSPTDSTDEAFLKTLDGQPKLMLLGPNQEFFPQVLEQNVPSTEAASRSQRLLIGGYGWVHQKVTALLKSGGMDAILRLLDGIRTLEVLEFVEADEGKAIRMFLSVNDRGVLLSNMDKAKSILIYYSNRFLGARFDDHINLRFGECFHDYKSIKELGDSSGFPVRQVSRETFTEDDVLRYHYLAFDSTPFDPQAKFDYYATSDYVLNTFIKGTLKRLRSEPNKLGEFISNYVDDLAKFFGALRNLVEETRRDIPTFQLLCVLNLSATLYPLLVRLRQRNLLSEIVPNNPTLTLLKLIEIADIRVYKTRGTEPARDVLTLAREASSSPVGAIADRLRAFVISFMEDSLFRAKLGQDVYGNMGLNRIFFEYEKSIRARLNQEPTIAEWSAMLMAEPTIEHILPDKPSFAVSNYGFTDREDYDFDKHHLGNLTLLEKSVNSRANNESVEDKIRHPRLYQMSDYKMTREVAIEGAMRNQVFSKKVIEQRTAMLSQYCIETWPVWGPAV